VKTRNFIKRYNRILKMLSDRNDKRSGAFTEFRARTRRVLSAGQHWLVGKGEPGAIVEEDTNADFVQSDEERLEEKHWRRFYGAGGPVSAPAQPPE
jgi:hypothetical protein